MTVTCSHPASSRRELFPARDYITGDRFAIVRCAACGLVRTLPPPGPNDLPRYYPRGYYGQDRRYPLPLEWLLDRLYASRARSLQRATGIRRGHALDIGCGRGSLLFHLRRLGWSVVGTELSDESARYAREALHLDVRTGELGDAGIEGPFDLIILWHVLEHVPDPAGLLEGAARLLRPGGILLVAVPNFGSYEARLARAGWFHLDVPRHLNHFTPDVLVAVLEGAGLEPGRRSYFSIEYDSFSLTQSVLNRLGLRHNLLYDLIRTRGAKVLRDRTDVSVRDVVATLLLAPLLLAAGPIWLAIAVALNGGATVSILARKPQTAPPAAPGSLYDDH